MTGPRPDFLETLRQMAQKPDATRTPDPKASFDDLMRQLTGGGTVSNGPDPSSYTVNNVPFNTTSGEPPSRTERGITEVLDALGRKYASKRTDAPSRFYREAVFDRRQAPFTEHDLTDEEQASLARSVVRARGAGRSSSIGYRDYDRRNSDPLALVLGRADTAPSPDGGVDISDRYDFNNYERGGSIGTPGESMELSFLSGDLGLGAWLGRRALPDGIRGVPVQMHLTADQLSKADTLFRGPQTRLEHAVGWKLK